MINDILAVSTNNQPVPVVGMPATILQTLDRLPGTIVGVERVGKQIIVSVRQDEYQAGPNGGEMGHQDWVIVPDHGGPIYTFGFSAKSPRWRRLHRNENGRLALSGSNTGLRIGEASVYRCWEF